MIALDDYFDAVGGTPLVRINQPGLLGDLLVKVEGCNPTGSVKDRAAIRMISAAEESGLLRRGATLVEGTSGNMGVALASIAAAKGYRTIIVTPDSVSEAKRKQIEEFGAKVILTPAIFGTSRAYAEARRIAENLPEAFVPDQSRNPCNPAAHAATTGPEIWQATNGAVDVVVAGVGTGGTISGIGHYLLSKRPDIEIVAVEPSSSAVLSGGSPGPHRIVGIGAGYIPEVLDRRVITRIETVTDNEAESSQRELSRRHGIAAGLSSGAAVHVATRLALQEPYRGKVIVSLLPDRAPS